MKPLDPELQVKLFQNANKKRLQDMENKKDTKSIIDTLSERQAMQIYSELLDVYLKHNISYRAATELSIAMAHAFLTGAAELYENED